MLNVRPSRRPGLLVAGMALLFTGPVLAADLVNTPLADLTAPEPALPPPESHLSLQAVGTETGIWDQNPLMLIKGATPLYGSITAPELIFNDRTPTSQFLVDTTVDENLFNLSTFDSTDFHQNINLTDQNERWGVGVQEKTDYDTTRTSELTPIGIDTIPIRHLGVSLSPEVSFSPTATDKLSLLTNGVMSQYDSPIYSNYAIVSATPTYTHIFDPLNAGTLSVQAQQYQTISGPKVTVDTIGPSVGWIATLTPRWTAKATVGLQEADQSGSGTIPEPWSLQYIFSADIGFKGEQDTTDFIASRADYPFGNGTESLLTTFTMTEAHNLNPLISLNLTGSYQTATYQSSAVGSIDTLISASPGLAYHVTDQLDFVASYQYRIESFIATPGNAQDNTVTFGIVYHPQSWAL